MNKALLKQIIDGTEVEAMEYAVPRALHRNNSDGVWVNDEGKPYITIAGTNYYWSSARNLMEEAKHDLEWCENWVNHNVNNLVVMEALRMNNIDGIPVAPVIKYNPSEIPNILDYVWDLVIAVDPSYIVDEDDVPRIFINIPGYGSFYQYMTEGNYVANEYSDIKGKDIVLEALGGKRKHIHDAYTLQEMFILINNHLMSKCVDILTLMSKGIPQ